MCDARSNTGTLQDNEVLKSVEAVLKGSTGREASEFSDALELSSPSPLMLMSVRFLARSSMFWSIISR